MKRPLLVLALALAVSACAQQQPGSSPPPTYCNPCLFFSGNPDIDYFGWNDFSVGGDVLGGQISVYSPFHIPTNGGSWVVTGVFINALDTFGTVDPIDTPWQIRAGMVGGSKLGGGTVVAQGSNMTTLTPTGYAVSGVSIDTFYVDLSDNPVTLSPLQAPYWLSVTPQCTNANNPACTQFNDVGAYGISSTMYKGQWFGTPPPLGQNFTYNAPAREFYTNLCELGQGCNVLSFGLVGTVE